MKTHTATLTEIENQGLISRFNFADGHADQDLQVAQKNIIQKLPAIWLESSMTSVKEQEKRYLNTFAELSQSASIKEYPFFKICPTASNSIDVVAAWLADQGMRVALVEPTFDNLSLLLKRRGVAVTSFCEASFHANGPDAFAGLEVDAFFFVNPNNPTGKTLTKEQFQDIVSYCAQNDKLILLDNTFRFFVPQTYDQYKILIDSGVGFISIEDTGKVWPTQDMKASLMIYSESVRKDLEIIYEEIYLCVSKFSLAVLDALLTDSKTRGLDQTIWSEAAKRRKLFREAIAHSVLSPTAESVHSKLSVEWVEIQGTSLDDLGISKFFQARDLTLLPGRNFYWSREKGAPSCYLRFSLFRPEMNFLDALDALKAGLSEINTETSKEFRHVS